MKKVFRRPAALALVAVATVSFGVFIVASATAATKHKTASVDVCVLLPIIEVCAAFKKAGVKASITNALDATVCKRCRPRLSTRSGRKGRRGDCPS